MPFAHLKTGRFHYEVFGDKQLPAVLLIMGLGMPAAGWPQSFISMLLEKSLRVITVDNRDAGLSEHFSHLKTSMSVPAAIGRTLLRLPVQAPYLLEDMALDLVQLLDELKLQRAHVVGASMGGMIGQTLALDGRNDRSDPRIDPTLESRVPHFRHVSLGQPENRPRKTARDLFNPDALGRLVDRGRKREAFRKSVYDAEKSEL